MKLSIVIVHYRTADLLSAAIESVRLDLLRSRIQAEILVIDNGREPHLAEMAATVGFELFQPDQNVGYGAGLNLGVSRSQGEIVFLMNADVVVLPGATSKLLDALERVDIAAPRLFWDHGRRFMLPPNESTTRVAEVVRKAGQLGHPLADWARVHWRRHARRHLLAESPLETGALGGAFLATHREVWEKVGPFDSRFFLYFEETDWLKRAHKQGYGSYLVPAASAVHLFRQSPASRALTDRVFAESYERHSRRYYGRWFQSLLRVPTPEILPSRNRATSLCGNSPRFTLTSAQKPLWVEVSCRREGFPAAAELLESNVKSWKMPAEILQQLAKGRYWIRVVGVSALSEVACYSFEHGTGESR